MIGKTSWRRRDTAPLEAAPKAPGAHHATLSRSDHGTVAVLHLSGGDVLELAPRKVGQLVVVASGEGTVQVAGEQTPVRTGDAVRWPRGAAHGASTDSGLCLIVVTYEEPLDAWRVARVRGESDRWVEGVFTDTDRARRYRDQLRADTGSDDTIVLE